MDLGGGVDGVELDLLCCGRGARAGEELGGAGLDAGRGCVNVFEEDSLGLVVGGCDSGG